MICLCKPDAWDLLLPITAVGRLLSIYRIMGNMYIIAVIC